MSTNTIYIFFPWNVKYWNLKEFRYISKSLFHKSFKMKKFLILIPFLMLAWCETATVQEETPIQNTEEQTKEEVVVEKTDDESVLYIGDDKAWFVMESESGPIYLIPKTISETTELKSNNQFEEDAVAWQYSKFVVVSFLFDNQSKNTLNFSVYDIPELYDSEWRSYHTSPDYTYNFYLPNAVLNLEVRPWIPTEWYVVYEVSKDSSWFYMQSMNWKILMQER